MTEQTGTHFLTDIEIKQFKCFTNFKASGFKRVNLIGGKNNVGKTAFMEACYINVHSTNKKEMLTAIGKIKYSRERVNLEDNKNFSNIYYVTGTKNYESTSNLRHIYFLNNDSEFTIQYSMYCNDNSFTVNLEELNNITVVFHKNLIFIDSFGFSNSLLSAIYITIQYLEKENELSNLVNEFDNSIENFKVIGDKPQCKTNGEYRDITEFGDGLKHYISIICALYACENGYLFIDEIDNGIYYDHLDRLWEIILTLSKQTNCQVFATTHSKEMLESFARVAKKLDERDISYTLLVKNKNQEIKSITDDYEMLLDSIEQKREVRGW